MTSHVEQQMPVPNGHPSIQSLVRADLELREQVGISRYGTALQPNNGRDALRDGYEEAMDLTCYLKQAMVERDSQPEFQALRFERDAAQATADTLVEQLTDLRDDVLGDETIQVPEIVSAAKRELERLTVARDAATALADELLMLFAYAEKGHPGRPCIRTGWVTEETIARFRQRRAELGGQA